MSFISVIFIQLGAANPTGLRKLCADSSEVCGPDNDSVANLEVFCLRLC